MAGARSQSKAKQARGSHAGAGSAKAAPRALRANASRPRADAAVEPLMDATAGRDIAGVALAVVAVASSIAVVSPANAPVTQVIANFYHLGFGLGAYVLPLGLLVLAANLFLRDRAPLNPRTLAGLATIFVAACGMLSLLVPETEYSTAGMFAPEALASSGGYLGAFVASTLQGALGKAISGVVLVGVGIGGMVVIGFSISSFVQSAADRARSIAERRHVDVNAAPWGDESALGGAADGPARSLPPPAVVPRRASSRSMRLRPRSWATGRPPCLLRMMSPTATRTPSSMSPSSWRPSKRRRCSYRCPSATRPSARR